MSRLPPELVFQISRHLEPHKPSLISLASLNSRFYQLIKPIVYERVEVLKFHQILSFCNSITGSKDNLGIYVEYLHIEFDCDNLLGDSLDDEPREVAAAIFSALGCMANLKELGLLYDTDLYVSDVLSSIQFLPPFQLTHLKTIVYSGANFRKFLHDQSSIVSLELMEPNCRLSDTQIHSVVGEMSFLPNLSELTADIEYITEIAPNRPIQKVTVRRGAYRGSVHFPNLISSLCESSVTEISIGSHTTYPSYDMYYLWECIENLAKSELAARLLALDLDLWLDEGLAIRLGPAYNESYWEQRVVLAAFTSLQSIRIGKKQVANDPDVKTMVEGFGRMKELSSWQSICRTLRRVEVFGEVLE